MSDLVFEDSPLTRSNVDSRHGECWSDSRTTSRAALYRLAELVIDLVDTSEAPVANGNACGPRALDGRTADGRTVSVVGKGLREVSISPLTTDHRCAPVRRKRSQIGAKGLRPSGEAAEVGRRKRRARFFRFRPLFVTAALTNRPAEVRSARVHIIRVGRHWLAHGRGPFTRRGDSGPRTPRGAGAGPAPAPRLDEARQGRRPVAAPPG